METPPDTRRLVMREPTVSERQRLATLRAAGVNKDASQAALLLEVVRRADDTTHYYTALHALSRIGGSEAMQAAEDAIAQLTPDSEAQCFARAVRARLLAQEAARSLADDTPQRQAEASVNAWQRALGYDVASFNATLAHEQFLYRRSLNPRDGLATFAIRQLADIIYCERNLTLLKAAQECGLNFDLDTGAKYKAQLAPLSSQERVEWIASELSDRKALTGDDYFLIQLAADKGKIASRAAAVKLREMDKNRDRYLISLTETKGRIHRQFPGYYGLFYTINCVADPDKEPFVAAYMNDPEINIASHAQKIYRCFKEGAGPQYSINY